MKKFSFLLGLLAVTCLPMHAQMDASIKLNEVMTDNHSSLIDEYVTRHAWVEIANISHSTYNIRGMYLTTDRSVLDKSMSVPERVKRMSQIPNGDVRTNLSGRQFIVFQLNSEPSKGSLHLAVKVDPSKPTWIALYNGNATQLIDSVTVPVLNADQSFARISNNGNSADWEVKSGDRVTVGIQNMTTVSESKIEKFKREDPYGASAKTLMALQWPLWLWASYSSVWLCCGFSSLSSACSCAIRRLLRKLSTPSLLNQLPRPLRKPLRWVIRRELFLKKDLTPRVSTVKYIWQSSVWLFSSIAIMCMMWRVV